MPVIDHWWQTETGWSICANPVGLGLLPVKYGSPGVPMPGYDLQVLDDAGHPVAAGHARQHRGEAAAAAGLRCRRSGTPTSVFATATSKNFPGYYKTADAGYIDADGYAFVMSRTDDIINVAGHRLSTGAMEEVLSGHPDVAECAVIGVADALKGQVPCGFVVLKAGRAREARGAAGRMRRARARRRSARSPPSAPCTSSNACRRRAAERSSAPPCARSPRARPRRCRRRSTIRRSWRRYARRSGMTSPTSWIKDCVLKAATQGRPLSSAASRRRHRRSCRSRNRSGSGTGSPAPPRLPSRRGGSDAPRCACWPWRRAPGWAGRTSAY